MITNLGRHHGSAQRKSPLGNLSTRGGEIRSRALRAFVLVAHAPFSPRGHLRALNPVRTVDAVIPREVSGLRPIGIGIINPNRHRVILLVSRAWVFAIQDTKCGYLASSGTSPTAHRQANRSVLAPDGGRNTYRERLKTGTRSYSRRLSFLFSSEISHTLGVTPNYDIALTGGDKSHYARNRLRVVFEGGIVPTFAMKTH